MSFYRCELNGKFMLLVYVILLILLFCAKADLAAITWTVPSPPHGPITRGDTSPPRRTIQTLIKGSSNQYLTWDFTISGETLDHVLWDINGIRIGKKTDTGILLQNHADRFNISTSDPATLIIYKVTEADAAIFRCEVETKEGGIWADEIQVKVVDAPTVTTQQCSSPVIEGNNATLYCNATGNPTPSIAWIRASTREVLSNDNMHMITAVKKNESGSYTCHASNGIGNNSTKSCTIVVQYRPKILNLPRVYNVTVQQSVTLQCQAEGNPTPSFAWTPCKDGCDKNMLVIPEVLNDTVYTCTVKNGLGSDSETATVVIAGKEINITMTRTGKICTNDTLLSEIDKAFVNEAAYSSTTLKDVRSGGLIVDLSLKFNSIVSEKWVLKILKEAIKDGKLGECNVAASSIKGTRPVISTTAAPPNGKTTSRSSDDTNIGLIVGCAVGGFIALVIIIALVIWCVRKNNNKDKDKKRKSNKEVSDNEAEEYRMAQFQGSHPTQGHGNNGYENTGSTSRPPAANAGKKDKKGKKKQDEPEKPVGVVYAQVDKSKRTSKPKEPEALYDQAERPNSKRPGELQYASPEDLHQGHSMPRNSGAQPKKPEAYTETQYAVLV